MKRRTKKTVARSFGFAALLAAVLLLIWAATAVLDFLSGLSAGAK